MAGMSDLVGAILIALGAAFFVAGTVGLLRFPDLLTRLHAPTKADNVGLGLVVAGLAVWHGWSAVSLKLLLIWLVILPASGLGAHLIAREARRRPPTSRSAEAGESSSGRPS